MMWNCFMFGLWTTAVCVLLVPLSLWVQRVLKVIIFQGKNCKCISWISCCQSLEGFSWPLAKQDFNTNSFNSRKSDLTPSSLLYMGIETWRRRKKKSLDDASELHFTCSINPFPSLTLIPVLAKFLMKSAWYCYMAA